MRPGARITARAQCFEKTAYCLTETLTFARANSRSIAPLHRTHVMHELAGKKIKALDYHAASWGCVPGHTGGSYLMVALRRAAGGNCSECEYLRLYDLNGRLIAAELAFDEQGRARDNKRGREMMHEIPGAPELRAVTDVYP